jgi:hypothetical protein
MSYLNTKTGRSYDFFAPEAYEGERLTRIPFPIPVKREVDAGGEVTHDASPALVSVAPTAAALTVNVTTDVQPGSLMIVTNAGSKVATVGGAACAAGEVTTLLYDGNGYLALGSTETV